MECPWLDARNGKLGCKVCEKVFADIWLLRIKVYLYCGMGEFSNVMLVIAFVKGCIIT